MGHHYEKIDEKNIKETITRERVINKKFLELRKETLQNELQEVEEALAKFK